MSKTNLELPSTGVLLIQFLAAKLVEAADLGDFKSVAKMATVQGQLLGLIASQPGRPKRGSAIGVDSATGELDTEDMLKALREAGVNI